MLRIIRIFRVARVFKMSKNLKGMYILARTRLYKSASALAMLVFFILITLVVFSTIIYNIEGPVRHAARSVQRAAACSSCLLHTLCAANALTRPVDADGQAGRRTDRPVATPLLTRRAPAWHHRSPPSAARTTT